MKKHDILYEAILSSMNKETNTLPEWAQQSLCYDKPIYSLEDAPSQKEMVWFDDWDGEWHNFKSYDELLRYVLNAYGFLAEDIEKISNEIPNARWDAMTLWEMRNSYTRGDGKTVDDIIKEFGFMKDSENITMPSEDEVDKIFQEVDGQLGNLGKPLKALAADAIEDVFGIGEDALDPNDPDFWMKHDRAKHGGHFDPETQTCKLREQAVAAEEEREKADELDDMGVGSVPDEGTEEKGISRIFTGSAADYSKPSLMKVGTGEGSQVYGWGLYGSDQKGVAETYADVAVGKNSGMGYMKNGKPIQVFGDSIENKVAGALGLWGDVETAIEEMKGVHNGEDIIRELKEHGHEYQEYHPQPIIYEQTFFTDREPGDESHLLKWYEPVSNKNMRRVLDELAKKDTALSNRLSKYDSEEAKFSDKLDKEQDLFDLIGAGADVDHFYDIIKDAGLTGQSGQALYSSLVDKLGSPKSASEILARAGIDGVKYPVDSYGRKTVKDGDIVGWNYVSFRDDNIRIDKKYVDGQKVFDYQELMAKKFPGVDAMAVLQRISKMGNPEAMAAEFRRILGKGQIAEDSLNDVMAAAIEAVYGICEDGSVDMAAHNRRYHPNGLNENTHCKYLKKGESAGEGKQDTVRPRNATENLQKNGFDLAEKWLKENGNILTFHATTKEDLDFMGLNDFAKEKMKKGHPLGREAFEKVVESVCRECQYLKRRFPNIRFGFDVLYPYEVSGSDIGGISALDRRSGFGCLIIGDENNFYRLVGNRDERAYRWVIRHELGHSLSSAEISKRFDDVIEKKVMEKYGKDRLRTFLKTICNVGEAWLTANNAVEKTMAKEEIIADIFALYTAPEYKKGYLPKELEDFCEEMIKGEHVQQQNGMLAMDGMDKKIQYPRHLGYVEGLFESKAMHNPPRGSTRPYALNCIKDKWEFFDTIEERDAWAKKHEKECRRYTMEDARAWMEQELPKIVAHIKGKNSPRPSRDEGEKKLNEYAADAVEGVFGIGEDGLGLSDADFWAKHDKARHGGHFDPETMTCKLREKYEQGEKIENLRDEMDDIEGESPDGETEQSSGMPSLEEYNRLKNLVDAVSIKDWNALKRKIQGIDTVKKEEYQKKFPEGWFNPFNYSRFRHTVKLANNKDWASLAQGQAKNCIDYIQDLSGLPNTIQQLLMACANGDFVRYFGQEKKWREQREKQDKIHKEREKHEREVREQRERVEKILSHQQESKYPVPPWVEALIDMDYGRDYNQKNKNIKALQNGLEKDEPIHLRLPRLAHYYGDMIFGRDDRWFFALNRMRWYSYLPKNPYRYSTLGRTHKMSFQGFAPTITVSKNSVRLGLTDHSMVTDNWYETEDAENKFVSTLRQCGIDAYIGGYGTVEIKIDEQGVPLSPQKQSLRKYTDDRELLTKEEIQKITESDEPLPCSPEKFIDSIFLGSEKNRNLESYPSDTIPMTEALRQEKTKALANATRRIYKRFPGLRSVMAAVRADAVTFDTGYLFGEMCMGGSRNNPVPFFMGFSGNTSRAYRELPTSQHLQEIEEKNNEYKEKGYKDSVVKFKRPQTVGDYVENWHGRNTDIKNQCVIVHELGHAILCDKNRYNEFVDKCCGSLNDDSRKNTFRLLVKNENRLSTRDLPWLKYVSDYAKENIHELHSECLAMCSLPDYEKGILPKPIEDYCFSVLNGVENTEKTQPEVTSSSIKEVKESVTPTPSSIESNSGNEGHKDEDEMFDWLYDFLIQHHK